MSSKQSISPLLELVVKDNLTYKFPIESINKELTSMFLEPLEFDYFMIQSYRKLKKDYGDVVAHIFLQILEFKLSFQSKKFEEMSIVEYQSEMEKFLHTLDNLYITRIEKDSPDGEMMTAMV